jgi:hypothetical protein
MLFKPIWFTIFNIIVTLLQLPKVSA